MKLRELINRLEQLSHDGANDDLNVVVKTGNDWEEYPQVTSAYIAQDPDYNSDEANCGPVEWVQILVNE